MNTTPIVRAPLFMTYAELRCALRAMEAMPVKLVKDLLSAIHAQTGTPQNPVDWSDPDRWIPERLSGDVQNFARKIWEQGGKVLNPRHLYGSYLLINRVGLLEKVNGIYRMTPRGKAFLVNDEGVVRQLDEVEGIPKLLSLIAERSPCKRGDLLPAWSDYMRAVSLFKTPGGFAYTLSRRIANLSERGLVARDGNTTAITAEGLAWLKGFASTATGAPSSKQTTVMEAAKAHNDEQLDAFKTRLMGLDPYQFEHFVKELLEAMDYEDIQVTKATGDKGVDVVARVQLGITEITEVVQVKRTEGSISREIVDKLRGALPYHKAIRGTIISLGSFPKGAREGALFMPPITLIDGKRLLDLCIRHQVGITRRTVDIFEVNEGFFAQKFGSAEEVPAGDDMEMGEE
ncbi:MAG: restriction endonuclease [Magnetospirillum sp.]|nr:restriction endonuclease [Magnetospirillum sp.]